jgi:hypothetical protein
MVSRHQMSAERLGVNSDSDISLIGNKAKENQIMAM